MNRYCGLTVDLIEERMLDAYKKGLSITLLIANRLLLESMPRCMPVDLDCPNDSVIFLNTGLGSIQVVVDNSQDPTSVILADPAKNYFDCISDVDPNVEFNA